MKAIIFLLLLTSVVSAMRLQAQQKVCLYNAALNNTATYYASTSSPGGGCGSLAILGWEIDHGEIVSESVVSSQSYVTVRWTTPGIGYIRKRFKCTIYGGGPPIESYGNLFNLNVEVVEIAAPNKPSVSYAGSNAVLAFSGSPLQPGTTWYWQSRADGRSKVNGADTWIAPASGTYYLQSYNSDCGWGPSVQIIADGVNTLPPPQPIVLQDVACQSFGSNTVTFHSNNITDRWYNTQTGGTPLVTGTTFERNKNDTGYYYVEAVSANGLTSVRTTISVVLRDCQEVCNNTTNVYTATTNIGLMLTGQSWLIDGGSVVSGTDTQSSVTVLWNRTGVGRIQKKLTYRFAGDPVVIPDRVAYTLDQFVYVQTVPALPAQPTIRFDCGVAILGFAGTAPAHETWYWQKQVNGTETSNRSSTFAIYSPDTYFLRSKNLCSWSDAREVPIAGQWLNCDWQPRIIAITNTTAGITSESSISITDSDNNDTQISYLDGLGRPLQSVNVKMGLGQKDVVTPFEFDATGRERIKYLPYLSAEQNGSFKANSVGSESSYHTSEQYLFYNNPGNTVADNAKPYSEVVYESGDLNRVLKNGSPGVEWQPLPSQIAANAYSLNDRTIKKRYRPSVESDSVKLINYNSSTGLVTWDRAYHGPSRLYATVTYDEHNNDVIEFSDKDGRTICKKVRVDAVRYAYTYYVYNEMGDLVMVLPPEGVRAISLGN